MAPKNPFDKIAKKNGTAAKKSNKIAAAVTKKIKGAVDDVINLKAKIKQLKSEQDQAEALIIDHVKPQQEAHARQGEYSKSFQVDGVKGSLTYTTQDKFTIAKDEEVHAALEELLGNDFDTYLKYVRTITLKPAVQENTALINKIVKACKDAGIDIGDAFEVKDVLTTQPGMDEKQFEMDKDLHEQFSVHVKQYKPALK